LSSKGQGLKLFMGPLYCELQKIVSAPIIVEGWYFAWLLTTVRRSYLIHFVMKRTRICFGRTDRTITIGRSPLCGGALIICYMFFNINVPFKSDYFVLISQHILSVFSFRGLKRYINVKKHVTDYQGPAT
jgi:hypothetical protein